MKFCTHCGKELLDEAVICPNCGCATSNYASTQRTSTAQFLKIAKIFFIISIVGIILSGILSFVFPFLTMNDSSFFVLSIIQGLLSLLPLAWVIPMYMKLDHAIKNNQPISTAFKVCTLIFVNIIAGILLLCDNSNKSY